MRWDKIFSCLEDMVRDWGNFWSLLLTMGIFSKHLLDLLGGEDKKDQVMEFDVLVVLVLKISFCDFDTC